MAQPSVASYFNTRKRSAVEDTKINQAKKVLVLDSDHLGNGLMKGLEAKPSKDDKIIPCGNKIVISSTHHDLGKKKAVKSTRTRKMKTAPNNVDIQNFLNKVNKVLKNEPPLTDPAQNQTIMEPESTITSEKEKLVSPPRTPTKKINAMDKVKEKPDGPTLKEIRRKMTRSSRLNELKSSLSKFQEGAKKLKEIEEKTSQIPESPKLKTFKTIELEVQTSPCKVFSPEKAYLSPRKDLTARRNLFASPTKSNVKALFQSPTKELFTDTQKSVLTLPFKYRSLAEMFRAIDTVVQILYNRKEVITFRKLKPAVEELVKRNLYEIQLGQIKSVYPDAFNFTQEKLKVFGTGMKTEQWELVIKPNIKEEHMTPEFLLERRRKLFNLLLEKVKVFHEEYLLSLSTPLVIPKDKITRWHPEFDIEKVPDIEQDPLPQPPQEDKMTTGKDVLEKAKSMFNCNTRMEQALERLKKAKEADTVEVEKTETPEMPTSVLKGIPKALLEKVRQRQAAKALVTITRSDDKEKELQIYTRLPELARLTRNVFVAEKKGVLPQDILIEKLGNSYRGNLSKTEMEEHLKVIAKEINGWLVFHNIRNCTYVKLVKNADLSLVIKKLENLVKVKSES